MYLLQQIKDANLQKKYYHRTHIIKKNYKTVKKNYILPKSVKNLLKKTKYNGKWS